MHVIVTLPVNGASTSDSSRDPPGARRSRDEAEQPEEAPLPVQLTSCGAQSFGGASTEEDVAGAVDDEDGAEGRCAPPSRTFAPTMEPREVSVSRPSVSRPSRDGK